MDDSTPELFSFEEEDIVTLPEASKWATSFLKKKVSVSNISYLIQYALIKKIGGKGSTRVSISELKRYYEKTNSVNQERWNGNGEKLNWDLSFEKYKESETTKHVHRLHPYKGKFIPQLVEYFLDSHTDDFKKKAYFKKGDIVLDPFCGSGTTLIQANELSIHAIGIDISQFNSLISNCKISNVDVSALKANVSSITEALIALREESRIDDFEDELSEKLSEFNKKYFHGYEYKSAVRSKSIDEKKYAKEKEQEFLPVYLELVKKYNIDLSYDESNFINKWFLPRIRQELYLARDLINEVKDEGIKNILIMILSRTMRSCRATTHSDLATLIEPVVTTHYCTKHFKICRPIFSISKWWSTYAEDTIERLVEFGRIKTKTLQVCLAGDSRNIDLKKALSSVNPDLCSLLKKRKIAGIFSSPPYVGLIDYHEQHAYAYELFGYDRKDKLEIGSLSGGQKADARNLYVEGIAAVLINCKKYLRANYNVFLVANDKHNLYPQIAEKAGMKIVNRYNRPVLNRSERSKITYSETIFHLKGLNTHESKFRRDRKRSKKRTSQ